MRQGTKKIFHLEAFVAKVMRLVCFDKLNSTAFIIYLYSIQKALDLGREYFYKFYL